MYSIFSVFSSVVEVLSMLKRRSPAGHGVGSEGRDMLPVYVVKSLPGEMFVVDFVK